MKILRVVAYTVMGISASSGCGQYVGGPSVVRPIVRVSARDYNSGQKASTLKVGATTRLIFMIYSLTDSVNTNPLWTSRNASVASNVGSTITGRALGTTYVVGEVTDEGTVFRDSVQVNVTP